MWKRVRKQRVQGRVARFRVPGGAEPDAARAPDEAMPLAASILWQPIDAAPGQDAELLPVFISQRALTAIHDHFAAAHVTCFGLLTGRLVRTADTGASYVVVESTIRLPGGTGDDAKAALLEGWVVAQDVVRRTGDQLVGWYRGRWTGEAGLTSAEAGTHTALFAEPWQVAVAVGSGDLTVGGVFRRSTRSAWAHECLPFYELVDPSSIRPDGSKPTRLRWDNYRTEETALVTSATPPGPAAVPAPAEAALAPAGQPSWRTSSLTPQVLWPDQFGSAEGARPAGRGRRRPPFASAAPDAGLRTLPQASWRSRVCSGSTRRWHRPRRPAPPSARPRRTR